jgi:type II secretory pathway pseudopilin PulG
VGYTIYIYTMKESIAVAKEADTKKGVSSTKSYNSIHPARNEPERQLGSLRGVINNIRRDGGRPSVESIATELSGVHATQRAPALLALQRTHGNRYVQRVVTGIQAKLKVGQPGDKYEQEADRIADTIMSMPESQTQQQWEGKRLLARTSAEPLIEQNGERLPAPCRRFFEGRLGYSFDNVRIHADHKAHLLSESLAARAFTYGTNIVFNRGEYNPAHKEGQRIIAHELVHIIQQNSVQPETAGSKPHPIHMQPSRQNVIQRIIPVPTVSPPECGSMSDARELLIRAHQVLESEEIGSDQYEALLSSISELESALENFEGTCRSSERPSSTVAPGGSVGMSLAMSDRSGALAVILAIVGFLAAIVTGSQLSSLDPEQQERVRQQEEALQRAAARVREGIRNLRREGIETLTDFYVEPTIDEATPEEIAEDIIPEDEPPYRDRCFVIPQGPRGGNAEHDALAARITGQPVEYLVISPSGRSKQFDGMDETNTLYEVKTRHDFIRVIDIIDSASQLTDRQIRVISVWIPDLHDDIEEESIIAYECGHPFHVATNNRNIIQALRVILNDILPADQIEYVPFSFNE